MKKNRVYNSSQLFKDDSWKNFINKFPTKTEFFKGFKLTSENIGDIKCYDIIIIGFARIEAIKNQVNESQFDYLKRRMVDESDMSDLCKKRMHEFFDPEEWSTEADKESVTSEKNNGKCCSNCNCRCIIS